MMCPHWSRKGTCGLLLPCALFHSVCAEWDYASEWMARHFAVHTEYMVEAMEQGCWVAEMDPRIKKARAPRSRIMQWDDRLQESTFRSESCPMGQTDASFDVVGSSTRAPHCFFENSSLRSCLRRRVTSGLRVQFDFPVDCQDTSPCSQWGGSLSNPMADLSFLHADRTTDNARPKLAGTKGGSDAAELHVGMQQRSTLPSSSLRLKLPCDCWGGSLSNPTVDHHIAAFASTPCSMWGGSMSNPTADSLQSPKVTSFPTDNALHESHCLPCVEWCGPETASTSGCNSHLALAARLVHVLATNNQPESLRGGSLPTAAAHTQPSQSSPTAFFHAPSDCKVGSCRTLVGPGQESTHIPSEPGTPPALLGREGPPRPNDISKLGLNRILFLPEHLARYPVNEIPVDQLGIYALEPGHARRLLRYSVFDRQRHHQHRTAAYGWSLNDIVSEATRSADERIKTVQVLTTTLPQLAVPQIVLTPADTAPNQLCVPIDLRPLGGRPCTLLLQEGMPAQDVIQEAFRVCPTGPMFAPPPGEARDLFLVDAQGNVWEELPLELSQLQWLRIQGRRPLDMLLQPLQEPQYGPNTPAPLSGATSFTTTWVMEQQNVQTVSFILAGLGSTIRLHPQHVSQARVPDSIADLVMAISRQRRLPPKTRVALVAAQPMPLQIQHIALLFIIYPEDERKHIILDPSGDGSMAQSISVDDRTRPEELLAEAQRRQGYEISVNGIPHSAMRRNIQTGDYVQVIHNPRRHRVSPTDWYYQIYPDLRLFASPLNFHDCSVQQRSL